MGCPQVLEKNLHVGHWNTNIQRIWTVQHEAEEFQSTTGCLCHTDGLCIPECFNSYIQCLYIYIYTYFSIHPFHLQSNSHSTTPQATNIFNPLFDLPLTIATEQLPFTTSDRAVGRQCTTALTPLQVLPCPWEDWPVTGDVANNLLLCWWNQCGLSVW